MAGESFGASLMGVNPMFGAAPIQAPAQVAPTPQMQAPNLGAPQIVSTLNAPNQAPALGGMNPQLMNMISMAGMMAGAISPKDSWSQRLGNTTAQMASQNIFADAQLQKDKDHRKFLTEAMKYYHPDVIKSLMNQPASSTAGYFNTAVSPLGTPGYPAPSVGGPTNG